MRYDVVYSRHSIGTKVNRALTIHESRTTHLSTGKFETEFELLMTVRVCVCVS